MSKTTYIRAYIARTTFTTLIDRFTSCAFWYTFLVYSNQLIKFALLTQSITQPKLRAAVDPAVRMALAPKERSGQVVPLLV